MGHRFTSTALTALMMGVTTPVAAQSVDAVRAFSIGAGPLERSLPVFAQQSGLQILYPSALVAGRQSPAVTGDYGPDVAEEVMTNCGVEIVFAPKELKIAQELSDRLGAYTTDGRSRSRPTGLSPGRRSTTVSDQRRELMLPQELMLLPQTALIVLKAGLPPIRGRKIAYFRERVFQRRLRAAPDLAPVAGPTSPPVLEEDPMDFDVIARAFAAEGLAPPEAGADEDAVGAWLDRVVDTAVLEREP